MYLTFFLKWASKLSAYFTLTRENSQKPNFMCSTATWGELATMLEGVQPRHLLVFSLNCERPKGRDLLFSGPVATSLKKAC